MFGVFFGTDQQNWTTYLVVFGVIVVMLLIVWALERLLPSKVHTAAGNALMHAETLFRPSREHVIEAKSTEKKQEDADGDPPRTGS